MVRGFAIVVNDVMVTIVWTWRVAGALSVESPLKGPKAVQLC